MPRDNKNVDRSRFRNKGRRIPVSRLLEISTEAQDVNLSQRVPVNSRDVARDARKSLQDTNISREVKKMAQNAISLWAVGDTAGVAQRFWQSESEASESLRFYLAYTNNLSTLGFCSIKPLVDSGGKVRGNPFDPAQQEVAKQATGALLRSVNGDAGVLMALDAPIPVGVYGVSRVRDGYGFVDVTNVPLTTRLVSYDTSTVNAFTSRTR